MRAERLRHRGVRKTRFGKAKMARGTTVDDAQLRNPDLVDAASEAVPERCGIGAPANKSQILPLVLPPLAKEILCGCDGQGNQ